MLKYNKSGFKSAFSILGLLAISACAATAPVVEKVEFVDPLTPKSSVDDAITSPLKAVTLVSNNVWSTTNFFEKGMGMSCKGQTLGPAHAQLWGLESAEDWELAACESNVRDGKAAEVHLLTSAKAGPETRSDFNVTRNGLLSLGFALSDIRAHAESLKNLNVISVDGVTTIDLPTGAGGIYTVEEIHYRGPVHSYILGISRPKGFDQIAPIDPKSGVGGPAYTAVIADDPDAFINFMKNVMGYEARRDIEFTSSGPGGGLVGIAKGTKMRFAQLFSPGSTSGYVIVLGVGDARKPATAEPRPPNQGLTMLSFDTDEYDEVVSRVKAAGMSNLISLPVGNGLSQRTSTFEAPNGVLIQLIEK